MRAIVVGAGIAGLATAWALARRGVAAIIVEQEAQSFSHSSGRNAAIFRPLETSPCIARLASESNALLNALFESEPWLEPRGLLLVAAESSSLDRLRSVAARDGVATQPLSASGIHEHAPQLAGGRARHGLFVPTAGVVDPHAIATKLERGIKADGGVLRLSTPALELLREDNRVVGVSLAGERLCADAVIVAAGAWARDLGRQAGLTLPLTPIRRHLAVLESASIVPAQQPTVWDVELETYFRPESGAVLASPCDETPWRAELPPRDPAALELLASRLAALAPALAEARVRTSWACLRTFASDRSLVVGPDPRAAGLIWVAGLGGFGMSVGPALGELAAQHATGETPAWAAPLLPARLLDSGNASTTSAQDACG